MFFGHIGGDGHPSPLFIGTRPERIALGKGSTFPQTKRSACGKPSRQGSDLV